MENAIRHELLISHYPFSIRGFRVTQKECRQIYTASERLSRKDFKFKSISYGGFTEFEDSNCVRYSNALHAAYHAAQYEVLEEYPTIDERAHVSEHDRWKLQVEKKIPIVHF